MKFHFCGGSDAPDWILTEVAVISKFSAVRMKLLCREVIAKLLGKDNEFNYERIHKVMTSKHFNFAKSDIKAIIAALRFILNNGAKYNLTSKILTTELEQIGMPRDTSRVICSSLQTFKEELRNHYVIETLHLPRLITTEWRTDFILSSSIIDQVNLPFVRMHFILSSKTFSPDYITINKDVAKKKHSNLNQNHITFEMTSEKFNIFFTELKQARTLFDQKV